MHCFKRKNIVFVGKLQVLKAKLDFDTMIAPQVATLSKITHSRDARGGQGRPGAARGGQGRPGAARDAADCLLAAWLS